MMLTKYKLQRLQIFEDFCTNCRLASQIEDLQNCVSWLKDIFVSDLGSKKLIEIFIHIKKLAN